MTATQSQTPSPSLGGLNHRSVLALLQAHQGRAFGLTAREAVTKLCGQCPAAKARQFRQLVMDLRDRGWPICSTAADGYYWPSGEAELKAALNWQRSRAIATLRQIGRQQRWGGKVLAGQQAIEGTGPHLTLPACDPPSEAEGLTPSSDDCQEGDRFAVLAAEIPQELWDEAEAWMANRPGWTRDRLAAAAFSLFLMQSPGCAPHVTRVYLDTLELS